MPARMLRKERIERQHALKRRVAQHQAIEQLLASIAQAFTATGLVGTDGAVVHRRTEEDARDALAAGTEAERQRQG